MCVRGRVSVTPGEPQGQHMENIGILHFRFSIQHPEPPLRLNTEYLDAAHSSSSFRLNTENQHSNSTPKLNTQTQQSNSALKFSTQTRSLHAQTHHSDSPLRLSIRLGPHEQA